MTKTAATKTRVFLRSALNRAIESYNVAYENNDTANTAYWRPQVKRLSKLVDRADRSEDARQARLAEAHEAVCTGC